VEVISQPELKDLIDKRAQEIIEPYSQRAANNLLGKNFALDIFGGTAAWN
jgi:hypothetical protein